MGIDYLIVGQGLAGSLLAWRLVQQNCTVVIVDSGQENATQVAAGIINPITGQRFVKSTAIETLLPAAKAGYAEFGAIFKQVFYVEKPMLRLFRREAEAKAGFRRIHNPDYHAYLAGALPSQVCLGDISAPFGGLCQTQTGHLLTVPLLKCLKAALLAAGCYRQTNFDYADLQVHPQLRWQDLSPQRVIFCEGCRLIHNPWFSWLPLQPVKGEILTLESSEALPDQILNYGHWLLPLDGQLFRVGATFDRHTLDTQPTAQGRTALLDNLGIVSPTWAAASVTHHQAQIRPCTVDRQPLIGHHPSISNLSVFNGFGAKGSLMIPWFSQQLVDALLAGTPLPKSCDIQRFYASHYPSVT